MSHRVDGRSDQEMDVCDSVTLCDQVALITRLLWNCKSVIGMLTAEHAEFTRGKSPQVLFFNRFIVLSIPTARPAHQYLIITV